MKCCFIHIPKCGGSSIKKELRQKLRWKKPLSFKEASLNGVAARQLASIGDLTNLQIREVLLRYELSKGDADLVFGHYRCTRETVNTFENQYHFVTLLRDPVERWISSYFYNRFKKSDYFKIDLDLDEYLKSDVGKKEGTAYTRFFSSAEGFLVSDSQIQDAISCISAFQTVGFLDDFSHFATQISGGFNIRFRARNRNSNPADNYQEAREAILSQHLQTIQSICKPDIEFYEQVKGNSQG